MLGSGRAGGSTNWETVHTEEDIGHWGESLAEFYILYLISWSLGGVFGGILNKKGNYKIKHVCMN